MKKTAKKPNLMAELTQKKMDAQKTGAKPESFNKFKNKKQRNENNSAVGPSWGGRKGN